MPVYNVATLMQHFEREFLQLNMFAYKWMVCFLVRQFSLDNIVRIWDTYICEENDTAGAGFSTFHVFLCAAFIVSLSSRLQVSL